MMKEIELTQGQVALVDDEDYERLSQWKWSVCKIRSIYYAYRSGKPRGKNIIYMHREILGLTKGDGKITDHRNRNGLDNRRSNLRAVDYTINAHNHRIYSHNTSGHSGVCWDNRSKKWRAYINIDRKGIYLGCYGGLKDAIDARKQGELEHWGEHCAP